MTTPDPKAMPDEQTTRDLNRLFGDELKEIRDISLRLDAHIAAQAEKIAKLEEQLDSPYCMLCGSCGVEGCCPDEMCKTGTAKLEAENKRLAGLYELALNDQATIGAGFEAAEADNKRLREALNSALGYMRNARIDLETKPPKSVAINTISGGIALVEKAIAQTEQKPAPCKTCGGKGFLKHIIGDCLDCNGTGREVK